MRDVGASAYPRLKTASSAPLRSSFFLNPTDVAIMPNQWIGLGERSGFFASSIESF